jgi:tellurite resistance-related uncharacterized protein
MKIKSMKIKTEDYEGKGKVFGTLRVEAGELELKTIEEVLETEEHTDVVVIDTLQDKSKSDIWQRVEAATSAKKHYIPEETLESHLVRTDLYSPTGGWAGKKISLMPDEIPCLDRRKAVAEFDSAGKFVRTDTKEGPGKAIGFYVLRDTFTEDGKHKFLCADLIQLMYVFGEKPSDCYFVLSPEADATKVLAEFGYVVPYGFGRVLDSKSSKEADKFGPDTENIILV